MLAGVGGIDLLLLIIAADEGIQPQTQEHFDICRLLEIQRGLVVLTKSDLVDQDALDLVKKGATAKFDESVDVAVNLGIDAKKSDQAVRGSVVLPSGTGKNVRVAVFAQGDKAKAACEKFSTPDKPRYAAGALGPTPKTASISPDVNDPGARNVHFEQLRQAYYEQVQALIEGGVDALLVETIFDTLNAKAALFAIDEYFEASAERLPLIISGTVTDASGRILSGQTVTAFWHSVRHSNPLSVGLNCALGATLMRPYVQELAKAAPDTFISCYPNAGLPNPMSDTGFDETPEITGALVEEFAKSGFLNIAGGCCGTTPGHIAEIAKRVSAYQPRCLHGAGEGGVTGFLSGLKA